MTAPEPYACGYSAFLYDLVALKIIDPRPLAAPLAACDAPGTFSVRVGVRHRARQYDLFAQVCPAHNADAFHLPGYERSIPLRPRT